MDYELLEKEVIYSGRIFDLARTRYKLPNGREHTYDLIDHHGAVTVLPIDPEGNIWFVKQFRVGAMEWLMELPAGVLEEGELPEASAGRELQEEIGWAAGSLVKLGEFFMVPGYSTEKLHIYLATDLVSSSLPADEDEILNVLSLPVRQVYEMAYRGEIRDGKTLATLLLAQPHLQQFRKTE